VHKITNGIAHKLNDRHFRWGQIGSASLVSLAHGTNDAQKTMGVMTLALLASGHWTDTHSVPIWVKFSAAIAIALGTYLGGWRIIRTLGKGLVDITPRQGMASDGSTAAVLMAASHLGFALSTTHVATGSVLGGGLGRGTHVRWNTAGRMVVAWATTFPLAGIIGAIMYWIGHGIGGAVGAIVVFAILCGASGYMFWRSQQNKVDHSNVTDEWDRPQDILDQHEPDHVGSHEVPTGDHEDLAAPTSTPTH
jgi:PiT family inorganic phosphate transporter